MHYLYNITIICINNNNAVIDNIFEWTRERISSKFTGNLRTRPQKVSLALP